MRDKLWFMESLCNYESDDEYKSSGGELIKGVSSAPLVSLSVLDGANRALAEVLNSNRNISADIALAPTEGPKNPFSSSNHRFSKSGMGEVEEVFYEDNFFNESYHQYLAGENTSTATKRRISKEGKIFIFSLIKSLTHT